MISQAEREEISKSVVQAVCFVLSKGRIGSKMVPREARGLAGCGGYKCEPD